MKRVFIYIETFRLNQTGSYSNPPPHARLCARAPWREWVKTIYQNTVVRVTNLTPAHTGPVVVSTLVWRMHGHQHRLMAAGMGHVTNLTPGPPAGAATLVWRNYQTGCHQHRLIDDSAMVHVTNLLLLLTRSAAL
jgi:hypothetical protein